MRAGCGGLVARPPIRITSRLDSKTAQLRGEHLSELEEHKELRAAGGDTHSGLHRDGQGHAVVRRREVGVGDSRHG